MQRRRSVTAMAAMLGLALGCSDALYFDCSDDGQCDLGGAPGVCYAGECAYPDGDCNSGYAYPSQARPPFAGQCVDEAGTLGDTGSTGPTGGSADSLDGVDTGDSSADGTESGGPQVEPRCHVVQLDAGKRHTCALTEDGDAWCWGDNANLELGVEGIEATRIPVKVDAVDAVQLEALSTRNDHTCAVTTTGQVWCWGDQDQREVDEDQSDAGAYLPNEASTTNVDRVAATGSANCALAGSLLACWGSTASFETGLQMGNGLNIQLEEIEQGTIAAGSNHVCAQTRRNAGPWNGVECWGWNHQGQVGSDPVDDRISNPSPVDLPGPADLPSTPHTATLALAYAHSCALVEQQTWCWGFDEDGQLLGTGTSHEPRRLEAVPPARSIHAGRDHTCVLTEGGELECWGANGHSQVTPTTTSDNETEPVSPAAGILLRTGIDPIFEVVGLGYYHSCGASPQTGILCWGAEEGEGERPQANDGTWLGESLDAHIGRVTLPDCP